MGVVAYLSLSGRWGGRLLKAGGLLTFSAFRMGAYSNKNGLSNIASGIRY